MTEFSDKPNQKVYPIIINGESVYLNIRNVGIAMFRHRPECDYVDFHSPTDEGSEEHRLFFNRPELVIWMGGIALGRDQKHILHLAEREHGTFYSNYGWNPPVFLEDYPSDNELDLWVDANTPVDLHAELSEQLKEDLDDGR